MKSNWIKWLIVLGPVVLLIIFVLIGMRSHRVKAPPSKPAVSTQAPGVATNSP